VRVRLVVNPLARRGAEGDAVRTALIARGIDCVDDAEDPSTLDAIVVAGGDGTVVSQIGIAIQHGLPIGVVPLGTFNDMARTLNIPMAIAAACDAIAGGATRAIDIGRVNGVYFVNEASLGISARAARGQTPDVKRRFGWLGIVGTTLQTLVRSVPFAADIVCDGASERVRTVQLTIANSNRFGSIWYVPQAAIDDGWLDLYSVEFSGFFQTVLGLCGLLRSRGSAPVQGLRRRSGTRFEILTRRPHHIVADGEPAGATPATFDLLPRAVRILVPAEPAVVD